MKLLFIGNAFSAHTVRWLENNTEHDWDIHLFDPLNSLIHPDLQNVTVHTGWKKESTLQGAKIKYRYPFLRGRHFVANHFPQIWRIILPEAEKRLFELIEKIQPDIIHSLGMQPHAYVVSDMIKNLKVRLSIPWVYSCWGSDIYYYQNFDDHVDRIKGVLTNCDYLICDCQRDYGLAKKHDFQGEFLGFFQGGGGYPIEKMQAFRKCDLPSQRKNIALKGLEGNWGRASAALQALIECKDVLNGYQIYVYQAFPEIIEKVLEIEHTLGLKFHIVTRVNYREIWRLFGSSRIAIGVNCSDGMPNAAIEAMIMGAFPIQSNPGNASTDWITDGINGFLVSHENVHHISKCIKEAITNDQLINEASEINLSECYSRIELSKVRAEIIEKYKEIGNR